MSLDVAQIGRRDFPLQGPLVEAKRTLTNAVRRAGHNRQVIGFTASPAPPVSANILPISSGG
jgi:hypothetical protein